MGSDFSLAQDGDSAEQYWAPRIGERIKGYELFWKRHIVPLTFRVGKDRTNRYLRPSIHPTLEDLADGSYAIFYHFAACHREAALLRNPPTDTRATHTDALYTFFCHADSLLDAVLNFAKAVDAVRGDFDLTGFFNVVWDKERRGVSAGGNPRVEQSYDHATREIRVYRNHLVHQRPVFLQNDWMPRADYVANYSGLASLARAARDARKLKPDFEPIPDALDRVLRRLALVVAEIFGAADDALTFPTERRNEKGETYAEAQLHGFERDASISLDLIERWRRDGFQ